MDIISIVGLNGLATIAAFGQYLILTLLLVGAALTLLPGRTVREEAKRTVNVFGWTLSIQKDEPKPEPKRVRVPTFSKQMERIEFLREFDTRPRSRRLAVRQGWSNEAYEKYVAAINTWTINNGWELYTVS